MGEVQMKFQIKKLEGKRKVLFYVLIVIMASMLILIFTMRDTLFSTTMIITYPDKCKEVYKNDILTTPVCENGRLLKEQQEAKKIIGIPNGFNLSNVTWK